MDFLLKAWAWLNGKKTFIGAVASALLVIADQLGTLIPFLGAEGVFVAKVVAGIVLVAGLLHKLVKALG